MIENYNIALRERLVNFQLFLFTSSIRNCPVYEAVRKHQVENVFNGICKEQFLIQYKSLQKKVLRSQ